VFKRLYQVGCDARFLGVTWEGDQGQIDPHLLFGKCFTPDYWRNVYNAFASSSTLATVVNGLTGCSKAKTVIAGHSLGNMLVSSAICDHGLLAEQYFMMNAAVAREAYSTTHIATDKNLVSNPNWRSPVWGFYPERLWASEWKNLYTDGRAGLTWHGRFSGITTKTNPHTFYSSGEDVAAAGNGNMPTVNNLVHGERAWIAQEMNKGSLLKASVNGLGTGDWNSGGGWGYNLDHYSQYSPNPLNPPGWTLPDTSVITDANLRDNPFFKPFTRLKLVNGGAVPDPTGTVITGPQNSAQASQNASAHASNYAIKAWLLAHEIPALSQPAAANAVAGIIGNDMNTDYKTGTWDTNEGWTHTAFQDKDMTCVWKLYDKWAQKANLRKSTTNQ